MHINTDMSRMSFLTVAALVLAILSPSVIANAFAEPSGGDSGKGGGGSTGDGGSSDDKPKTATHMSGHKKGDGGRLAVPGVPVVRADNKHKHKDSNGGGLTVPGVPVVQADGDNHDGDGSSYNNGKMKKFDTSKSSFRIGDGHRKIVEYVPGFNETFYNSTLPYCFAVTSGSCYNSSTGQVTVP